MRTSGILMPIFSLPSRYGIGTLGQEAYKFVDFLKKAGQTYWQILPVGVTSFGDSPYQSFSSFAGNPYFIDLDLLIGDGLLKESDLEGVDWGDDSGKIDYGIMYQNRYKVLRKAYESFKLSPPVDYSVFLADNGFWLNDFALFCALKDYHNGASFDCWENGFKHRETEYIKRARAELCDDIAFYKMIQYLFFKQWSNLKKYANENGIKIIGDIPIYVAFDSADVWSAPEQFLLDKDLKPTAVAGCPPDAFSEDGQLWGNPLYNWKYMKKGNYDWWIRRIAFATNLYDVVRIDHFRAFSAYFSIPYGNKTAVGGVWKKGPGKALFDIINQSLGKLNIIAEDLGTIDDDVRKLLKYTGYPGMKVLQFAFSPDSESTYLPHNITDKNCVVYTGTHDNDTAIGYMLDGDSAEVKFMSEYLRIGENDSFNWSLIKAAMATSADTVILQMQDFLGLDNTARINVPSTTSDNWQWRIADGCINDWLAEIIYKCTATYFRLPQKKPKNIEKSENNA